jgi:transcription factor-like protein/Zn(2)-Cys(6) binuclear cluster domain-containing protein
MFQSAEKAERVCSTCKARKKACDKQLPYCGYCSKRGLICRYDDYYRGILSDRQESTSSGDGLFFSSSDSIALRSTLSLRVFGILQSSGLSLPELSRRFFQSFHTWLPIISPRLFHETAVTTNHDTLPTEFSILVLSMYLIIQRPHTAVAKDTIRHEDIYITVKVLFAQLQAVLCHSITLVQASILITAYEYASGRPDAAYISIGTCIRMAQTMDLASVDTAQGYSHQDNCSIFRALEKRNLWWAIVILERQDQSLDSMLEKCQFH